MKFRSFASIPEFDFLSLAVPPLHKEYPVTWSSAVSLPHKEYTMSRSSAVLLSHTEQSVTWNTQFRTIYCDLNFRSSASARKDVIWNSALLLLHKNITFLWKIHSHSTIHPFLNFRADFHDWWTLWRTEKQRNRDAPGKSRGISWWHIMFILTHFATKRTGRLRAMTARTRQFYYVDMTNVNPFGRRLYLPDVMDYLPERSITVRGKKISSVRTALNRSDNDETSQACLCAIG